MTVWRHLVSNSYTFACQDTGDRLLGIIGLPMDWTTSYFPGTRFAPARIRSAACNIELYSFLTRKDIESYGYIDLGDISLPNGDVIESLKRIEIVTKGFIEDYPGVTPVFLGGEHLVTYPIVKAFADEIDLLLVFDAHGDLRSDYLGVKYSHATVSRRIVEDLGKKILIIGGRAFSKEELDFISHSNEVDVIPPPLSSNWSEVLDFIKRVTSNRSVYISIDMDAVDPGYAPGVSNPEPLGLTPFELLSILKEIVYSSKNIIGLDVVEVNPLRDVNDVTSILAGKIVIEFYGLILDRFH